MTKPVRYFSDIRKYENLHVAFWLVKDACWCYLFRPLGMIMVIPTLMVALHITWITRHDRTDLFHNIAITFWICANATWMTGEFYLNDNLRPFAMTFFTLGLVTLVIYYIFFARRERDRRREAEELTAP